jgi:hypothetical protein
MLNKSSVQSIDGYLLVRISNLSQFRINVRNNSIGACHGAID